MKSTIVPLYKCTQSELYSVLRSGWTNYQFRLATFTLNKGYYTDTYGTDALAEIDAAAALPDEDARREITGSLRVSLDQAAENALFKWQLLESYIIKTYGTELVD